VAEKIESRKVIIMRVLIVFFIAISVLIALNPPTFIAQLMGISWGALAGAFLAPFLLGLYWRGMTTASVWACFIWGVGFTVVNMLMGKDAPFNPIDCGAIAMVGGFPVVLVVSLFTKKLPQAKIDSIWKCYK
jgi:SSS family solute:Na+ symporter